MLTLRVIFEISPNKVIPQTEGMIQDTAAQIKNKAEDESIPRRYFLICQTCFWCASYIDITGNMEDLPYKACPTYNDNKIESL